MLLIYVIWEVMPKLLYMLRTPPRPVNKMAFSIGNAAGSYRFLHPLSPKIDIISAHCLRVYSRMARPLPQEPPRLLAADEIVPAMHHIIAYTAAVHQNVIESVTISTACLENVIEPLMEAENRACGDTAMIALLRKVSPDEATRRAAIDAQKLASDGLATQEAHRNRLHPLIKAIAATNEPLDVESAKLLEELLKEQGRYGSSAISDDLVHDYSEIKNKISSLCDQFHQNLRQENGGLWFTTGQLSGMPRQHLASLPRDDDMTPSATSHLVSFGTADYYAVMKYVDIVETRKQMYIANANKLPENVPLFKNVIALRDRAARLLGYKSHAERIIEHRLAKSPEEVTHFLQELKESLLPLGSLEMDRLKAAKREDLRRGGPDKVLYPEDILPWDSDYYSRLVEEKSGADQVSVAEYFPLQSTVPAILDLFSSLFDFKLTEVPIEERKSYVWHEDVSLWAVWDGEGGREVGRFLGFLYLDLLERPNKPKAEQNITLQSVSAFHASRFVLSSFKFGAMYPDRQTQGFQMQDGSRKFPSTVLLASFSRPGSTEFSLLTHREVKAIFHGMHALRIETLLSMTKELIGNANTRTRPCRPRHPRENKVCPL